MQDISKGIPANSSPKEPKFVPKGPSIRDLNLLRSSSKNIGHTPFEPSLGDMSPGESLGEELKVPHNNEDVIQKEGYTSTIFSEEHETEMNVEPDKDLSINESFDPTPIVCESVNPLLSVSIYEIGGDNTIYETEGMELEVVKTNSDNINLSEANKPLEEIPPAPILPNNNIEEKVNVVSTLEKYVNQESKMLNVDEFGRLVREGASDSELDDILYSGKGLKTSQS